MLLLSNLSPGMMSRDRWSTRPGSGRGLALQPTMVWGYTLSSVFSFSLDAVKLTMLIIASMQFAEDESTELH